jgi:thermitase
MMHHLSPILLGVLLLGLVVVSSSAAPDVQPVAQDVTDLDQTVSFPAYRPGQILVKFRTQAEQAEGAQTLAAYDLPILETLAELDVLRVAVAVGQEQAMVQTLLDDPLVEYAELDYAVHATIIPDDTSYDRQWGPQKIQAPAAWDVTTGTSDVIIAIVDTGVDLNHPDLNAKIVPGWDFIGDDPYAQDNHGHGSHVAGIAAAETDNHQGVAGISWGARIMPIKVLDANGDGYYSDVAEGVSYACNHGATIINLSLGGSNPSSTLENAVEQAYQNGCLMVAAAGNDADTVDCPARYPEVMAVAATNQSDSRASFSDYGPEIDVAAPGVDIYSTVWSPPNNHTYSWKQGTSMSAPFVSGEAALIWSLCPGSTNAEVRSIIQSTAKDRGAPGWDQYYGWGRIDASEAVMITIPPPILTVSEQEMVYLADATTGPWPQTLLVGNDAVCGSLDWTADEGETWVETDPETGQASSSQSAVVSVSVDKSGLTQGQTYTTTITVNSDTLGVLEVPQSVDVKFVYSDQPLSRTYFPLGMAH